MMYGNVEDIQDNTEEDMENDDDNDSFKEVRAMPPPERQSNIRLVKIDEDTDETIDETQTVDEEELWDKETDLDSEREGNDILENQNAAQDRQFVEAQNNGYHDENLDVEQIQDVDGDSANQEYDDSIDSNGLAQNEQAHWSDDNGNPQNIASANDNKLQVNLQNFDSVNKEHLAYQEDGGNEQNQLDNDNFNQQEEIEIKQDSFKVVPLENVDNDEFKVQNEEPQGIQNRNNIWEIGDRGPMEGDKQNERILGPFGQTFIDEDNYQQEKIQGEESHIDQGENLDAVKNVESVDLVPENNEHFQNKDLGHGGPGWRPAANEIKDLLSNIRLDGVDNQGSQNQEQVEVQDSRSQLNALLDKIESKQNVENEGYKAMDPQDVEREGQGQNNENMQQNLPYEQVQPINNVEDFYNQQNNNDGVMYESELDKKRQLAERNRIQFENAVQRLQENQVIAQKANEYVPLRVMQTSQQKQVSAYLNATEVSKILAMEMAQEAPLDSSTYEQAIVLTEIPPIKYLSYYKNPCWYDRNVRSGDITLRCLPYFFITGAPGWGVQRLVESIQLHQKISAPLNTQPNWWNEERLARKPFGPGYVDNFDIVAQIIRQFITKQQDNTLIHKKVTFDASAELLFPFSLWNRYGKFMDEQQNQHFFTPYQIKSILPNAKFVVLLSDPVERLYRWYLTEFKEVPSLLKTPAEFNVRVEYTFRKIFNCTALQKGSHICYFGQVDNNGRLDTFLQEVQKGFHGYILQQWYDTFTSNSIRIITLESLQRDPFDVLNSTFHFLGLEQPTDTVTQLVKVKTSDLFKFPDIANYEPMLETTKHLLQSMYKQSENILASHLGKSQMFY